MKTRARVDSNHLEIVAALKDSGCTVESLARMGKGCPDLLVGLRGRNWLIEVKGGRGLIRASQAAWRSRWNGQVAIVRNVDEAIEFVQQALGSWR